MTTIQLTTNPTDIVYIKTLLSSACRNDDVDVLRQILSHNSMLYYLEPNLLLICIRCKAIKCLELLFEMKFHNPNSIMQYLCEKSDLEVVKMIHNACGKPIINNASIFEQSCEIIAYLIDYIDPDCKPDERCQHLLPLILKNDKIIPFLPCDINFNNELYISPAEMVIVISKLTEHGITLTPDMPRHIIIDAASSTASSI